MHYVARVRLLRVETIDIPIIASTAADLRREAEAAVVALRDGKQDATLVGVDDAQGRPVFKGEAEGELPPGFTEVTWRGRIPTTNHEEAACLARIALADPDNPTVIFETRTADGRTETINPQREGFLH